MLKRRRSNNTASKRLGISGTRMRRTFEGRCVITIVQIRPMRAASREARRAEIPANEFHETSPFILFSGDPFELFLLRLEIAHSRHRVTQPLDHFHAALQKVFVWRAFSGPAFQNFVHAKGFLATKLSIV